MLHHMSVNNMYRKKLAEQCNFRLKHPFLWKGGVGADAKLRHSSASCWFSGYNVIQTVEGNSFAKFC